MLFITAVSALNCFNCFYPIEQFKSLCKISQVETEGAQEYFTFAKILVEGEDQIVKLKTIDEANLMLTFGLEKFQKETFLNIKAKKGLFRKTVADRSFGLILKNDVYEIDGKAELSWLAENNKQFHVECGNHIEEKYQEKQRVTCYNQKNGGKRTIQTPTLNLHTPVEFQISQDAVTNIALVRTGQRYGLKAEVKVQGEIMDTEMVKGDFKWNSFNAEQRLKLEYTLGQDKYSWVCATYKVGDEIPDKDLSLTCRIPKLEFRQTKVIIANGDVYRHLEEYGIHINMWVSKIYEGTTGKYQLNFWSPHMKTEAHSLLEKNDALELREKLVKYKANVPYYGWIRIICENQAIVINE